jgi:cell division protease FtsH
LSFPYWVTIFLALLWGQSVLRHRDAQTISYDAFLQDLRNGRVAEVTLSGAEIRGRYVSANKDGRMAFVAAGVDPAFTAELDRYHVRFSTDTGDRWGATLLAWIALVLLWNLIWRVMVGRWAQAGKP